MASDDAAARAIGEAHAAIVAFATVEERLSRSGSWAIVFAAAAAGWAGWASRASLCSELRRHAFGRQSSVASAERLVVEIEAAPPGAMILDEPPCRRPLGRYPVDEPTGIERCRERLRESFTEIDQPCRLGPLAAGESGTSTSTSSSSTAPKSLSTRTIASAAGSFLANIACKRRVRPQP